MKIAELVLKNKTTTLVLTFVFLIGGILSFNDLSRLEDPEFTIKEALIVTPYPGASADEVAREVSSEIEQALQQLGQLKEVESQSYRGYSIVTARIKDKYDKNTLPQVWDELRRKVGDAQRGLPPSAGPSIVNDDFGDVWGVFMAIHGDEYSDADLQDVGEMLRRELLMVKDVAKVELWGTRTEAVYIIPDRDRLTQLKIHPGQIFESLQKYNAVSDAGRVRVGSELIAIEPTGVFQSEKEFENLLITGSTGTQVYLRDIAEVRRGYVEPDQAMLFHDGHRSIGIGISTTPGGNVVEMGAAVEKRISELKGQIPLGIEFGVVSLQSKAVTVAIDSFLVNLVEAVLIVVVVLFFFMGLRSALIIGFVLALTILSTFIFMGPWNIALERISLGALVIALGMLVDNAIVVVDGILVRAKQGIEPAEASKEIVKQQALPLLGATAVAIMAFGAIGLSQDSTGEFCRSLFQVVLLSLGLSWFTGVTVTPLLCVMFFKADKSAAEGASGETGGQAKLSVFSRMYRWVLLGCIRFRWLSIAGVLACFITACWGFQFIEDSFFPASTRPQFMVNVWLPQGSHIDETKKATDEIESYLQGMEGTSHVTRFVGAGGLRFLLTYAPEMPNSAYAQFLVDVDDYKVIDAMVAEIDARAPADFPDAEVNCSKFLLGPGGGGKVQAKFSGPDPNKLRALSERMEGILYADGNATAIRTDWRQRVKVMRPVVTKQEANNAGIAPQDVSAAMQTSFEGKSVGVYREGEDLLPIIVRDADELRSNISSSNDAQIWSPAAQKWVPLRQVVSHFETEFEDEIVRRLNRKPTITVHADPASGTASSLLARIQVEAEALELGPEYELQWWGESRDSRLAQEAIAGSAPFFFLAMVLIVIGLFNSLRQPLIIWLTVPLSVIGVSAGLLLTNQPFGFMSLLGLMSLSGMLIKNAIVLVDEIEVQKRLGSPDLKAIVDAAISRLSPVVLAALTTALGMIPLLSDAFFVAMAVTIIAGLIVATPLTMLIIPVFYSAFFRVPYDVTVLGLPASEPFWKRLVSWLGKLFRSRKTSQ